MRAKTKTFFKARAKSKGAPTEPCTRCKESGKLKDTCNRGYDHGNKDCGACGGKGVVTLQKAVINKSTYEVHPDRPSWGKVWMVDVDLIGGPGVGSTFWLLKPDDLKEALNAVDLTAGRDLSEHTIQLLAPDLVKRQCWTRPVDYNASTYARMV